MKFSWKICFSTILISLVIFSVGGYVLMSALFQSTYDREVANASEENRMLRYSFVAYWNTTVQDFSVNEENVQKTAQAMLVGMKGSNARIRVSDEKGNILFDNTQAEEDKGLLDGITADKEGYMLRKTAKGYELQTAGGIRTAEDEVLYLEMIRDITEIYKERDEQYGIYLQWMAGILVIESLCCYGMAVWLLKPLKRLSETTGKISEGQLEVRADIMTQDEIGELAADFNDMAENLEKQFLELQEAARRQEDFIGSFAHELKTPLTSMIGYADMLRTRELQQEEQFQAANYIFKEGKRLEALSFKLLDLLVVRHQELELKMVSAKWLAEDICGMLQPALKKENISLEISIEDEQIFVEPDLMKTVILNLLDNGRKAIEGEGELKLLGRKEGKGFTIYVCDTGKGIPKEELSRITEAFYMVDKSRARHQGGAGLGLSICAEIVQRHGGTLKFQSVQGAGTEVRIYLPEEVSE